jgi:hypothetical protein
MHKEYHSPRRQGAKENQNSPGGYVDCAAALFSVKQVHKNFAEKTRLFFGAQPKAYE